MAAVVTRVTSMTFSPALTNGATTWASAVSQRLRLWGDVAPDQQPAAFVVTHNEQDEYRNLGTLRRRLHLGIWCYSRTDDPSIIGANDLDTMMQAFETAFMPDKPDSNLMTLGGLVYWCRIEGRVFKDPGDLDNQALLIVPLICEMP